MAGADHKNYLVRCASPQAIQAAIRSATQLLQQANTRLQSGPSRISEDDREWTPIHHAYVDIFKVEAGDKSMSQVAEIKDRFGYLLQAAKGILTLCVNGSDPMAGSQGQMGHTAFAEVGNESSPTIYFCPAFFGCTPDVQARTIIHELAHGRLGATHAGGEFLQFERCGASPLTSYDDALNNACTYDLFADCVISS